MALSGPRLRACPRTLGLIEECKKQKMELLTEKSRYMRKYLPSADGLQATKANTNYGKYGKGDRRRISLNKESALRPAESQKNGYQETGYRTRSNNYLVGEI